MRVALAIGVCDATLAIGLAFTYHCATGERHRNSSSELGLAVAMRGYLESLQGYHDIAVRRH